MKNLLASAAALVALCSHQGAMAAQAAKPCMSKSEFQSVAVVLLPVLHSQAVTSCKAFLPANAGLLIQSDELTTRYAESAARERIAAGDILARMLANELPVPMAGTAILPFVEGMVPAMLANGIDAKTCEAANNIGTALAPLPPENIAATLGAIMVAASKDKADTPVNDADQAKRPFDDFAVCPYVATLEAKRS
jgi:hypothetical protein